MLEVGRHSSAVETVWLRRGNVDIVAISVAVSVAISMRIAVSSIHAIDWRIAGIWLSWHLVMTSRWRSRVVRSDLAIGGSVRVHQGARAARLEL